MTSCICTAVVRNFYRKEKEKEKLGMLSEKKAEGEKYEQEKSGCYDRMHDDGSINGRMLFQQHFHHSSGSADNGCSRDYRSGDYHRSRNNN